jgi:hypothetical protein
MQGWWTSTRPWDIRGANGAKRERGNEVDSLRKYRVVVAVAAVGRNLPTSESRRTARYVSDSAKI